MPAEPIDLRPMLATHAPAPGQVPQGDQWVHEVKWDGIRLLAGRSNDGPLHLWNRSGIEVSPAYPEITALADRLPSDVLLDGEVIAFSQGATSFGALMQRAHVRDPAQVARLVRSVPVQFMVFDLLSLGGISLMDRPLHERREHLEALDLADLGTIIVPPQYTDGPMLAAITLEQGLEGVVSKRLDSRYQPGVRSPDWVKVPHRSEFVGVIGGWVPETQNPRLLGALWVGQPHDEETFETDPVLYPITRVGSGLSHRTRADLIEVLRGIEHPDAPFTTLPAAPEVRRSHWVEPILCVQVRYLGQPGAYSRDRAANIGIHGQLRQPVMRRLRPDLTPLEAPYADLGIVDDDADGPSEQ